MELTSAFTPSSIVGSTWAPYLNLLEALNISFVSVKTHNQIKCMSPRGLASLTAAFSSFPAEVPAGVSHIDLPGF